MTNPPSIHKEECKHLKNWDCDGYGKLRPDGLFCACECSRCMLPKKEENWRGCGYCGFSHKGGEVCKDKPKEENWKERFDKELRVFYTREFREMVNFDPIKDFIRTEIEKVRKEGFEEGREIGNDDFNSLKEEIKQTQKEEIREKLDYIIDNTESTMILADKHTATNILNHTIEPLKALLKEL